MTPRQEKAIQSFRAGLNCAQAVVTAYSEDLGFDNEQALRISCGFGGGMGRLQETCGALTGAYMVLGIHHSGRFNDNRERKEATYEAVRKCSGKFKTIFGASDCKTLLQADLNTEEGRRIIRENKLHDTICEKCISEVIAITDELIAG